MSRTTLSDIAGQLLTGLGFLAVVAGAMSGSVAWATPPVPEIDPASIGSVVSVVVGALALREGIALKRRGRG
ncbi:MAG: hypothetical protein ACKOEM_09415 [Planctomycetia bacterium]